MKTIINNKKNGATVTLEVDRTQESAKLKHSMKLALAAFNKEEMTAIEANLICTDLMKRISDFIKLEKHNLHARSMATNVAIPVTNSFS